jgi:hypothetical protein
MNMLLEITIQVRLYEELNRVLPAKQRKRSVSRVLPAGSRLVDLLDFLGLKPEEVDLALLNSRSASFQTALKDQDRVSLYPEFESFDIQGVSDLRDRPIRVTKFVAESSLSGLADLLQAKGFSCTCPPQASDEELVRVSEEDKRIILTTDPGLAMAFKPDRCFCLKASKPEEQLQEVLLRFQLRRWQG